jgi:hypothetical protein
LTNAELLEITSFNQVEFYAMAEKFDEAAARAFLTYQRVVPAEPMPDDLSARLRSMAQGFLQQSNSESDNNRALESFDKVVVAPALISMREIGAWLCVAASIALALIAWLPGTGERNISIVSKRDQLIASSKDLVRLPWTSNSADYPADSPLGEVVWSTAAQQGYMTFTGLAKNDPTKEQYQLWIIDPSRDEKPVDGGVFDVVNAAETIVPIQAKLRVDQPTVFAITVEKPGGVVVSDQKRLPLLAKVK